MATTKSKSSFTGRWHIVSMTEWDEDFIHEEEEGYFEFDDKGWGSFHFGYVHGNMNCQLTTRNDEPAVEWSWDGNDEMDAAQGRGWAVIKEGDLHGMIFFHGGDNSWFVAKKRKSPRTKK